VRTAGYYKPRALVRVTIRGGSGSTTRKLRAGRKGRVTVTVPIGPGNPQQQYSPAASATGTAVYTARVGLKGRRRAR
jgi:hypothetical protein